MHAIEKLLTRQAGVSLQDDAKAIQIPKAIWVVGDGRSGTTWLSNLINYHQRYRFLFEPLHPWLWNFLSYDNPYLYLRPSAGESYQAVFEVVLAGRLRSKHTDRYSPIRTNDDGLLIKDIFAHLSLAWAAQRFPHVKKILLLRHPFAVALSKAKTHQKNWQWPDQPKSFFNHPQLFADFLHPFAEILDDSATYFERQVLTWSIIHYIPLVQLTQAQVHLVFYEELHTNFEQEMRRLLAYLGDDAGAPLLDERLLTQWRTPAQTTQPFSAIWQHKDVVDVWRHQLSDEEMGMGDYILNFFGLGQLYNSQNLLPNRAAADYFLRLHTVDEQQVATPVASIVVQGANAVHQSAVTVLTPSGIHQKCKLAYLIVAHHQPNHLARLIQALNDDNSYFFIHIDKKVPIAPFQTALQSKSNDLAPGRANIVFLSNRVEVQWGKLSVVEAVLNLIHTAIAAGHAFNYYTLLSGSDYPIKNRREIYMRLQTSDRQFIRIGCQLTSEIGKTNPFYADFIKGLPKEKYFGTLAPYKGSMYWSLTADCIQFILDFLNEHPNFLLLNQHAHAPDEIVFHTIVKHSPFATAISQDFSDGIHPDNLHHGNHFIDWQRLRTRDYLTLDERDIDDLLQSDALFARKFEEQKSIQLLALLDQKIHYG